MTNPRGHHPRRSRQRSSRAAVGLLVGAAAAGMLTTSTPAAASSGIPIPEPWLTPNNQPPVFNDYVQCAGGYMYVDFRDPGGADNQLEVTLSASRPPGHPEQAYQMNVSDGRAHGVFWYLNLAATGISGAPLYRLQATDPWGAQSAPVWVDANCEQI